MGRHYVGCVAVRCSGDTHVRPDIRGDETRRPLEPRAPRRSADRATAAANGLPLYTRNPSDFVGLEDVVTIVAI